jgi:hypothetical protein
VNEVQFVPLGLPHEYLPGAKGPEADAAVPVPPMRRPAGELLRNVCGQGFAPFGLPDEYIEQ